MCLHVWLHIMHTLCTDVLIEMLKETTLSHFKCFHTLNTTVTLANFVGRLMCKTKFLLLLAGQSKTEKTVF